MSSKNYIIAYDLGTTGNKATLVDDEGKLIASTFSGYKTYYPRSTWVEQEPEDWWKAICCASKKLIEKSRVDPLQIAGLSFSGQMMGCVPVTKEAKPLGRALIWADQRGTRQAAKLSSKLGKKYLYKKVGHRPSASYSAAKIMWIKENQPQRYKKTYKFLQAKDFVAARMTGGFYTDFSDASGTNLFNLQNLTWSNEIIEAAGLTKEILPEAVPSTKVVGKLKDSLAGSLGLKGGIPVIIGGGDGCCAAAGAGVVVPGSVYNYLGSSSWIGLATKEPVLDYKMRTFNWAHVVPGLYSPTGTMQAAGASYQWMRDKVCSFQDQNVDYQTMDQKAADIPAGSNNLLYLPYLMGERSPYWDSSARGAFIGLTMNHTLGHMTRAVMEGVGMNLKIILDIFLNQGIEAEEIRLIGGGAKGKVWRQIIADIYNRKLVIPDLLDEATSMGAALIGGVGAGIYDDFSFASKLFKIKKDVKPDRENHEVYKKLEGPFKNSYNGLKKVYSCLKNIE